MSRKKLVPVENGTRLWAGWTIEHGDDGIYVGRGRFSASLTCAWNTGELDCGDYELSEVECIQLSKIYDVYTEAGLDDSLIENRLEVENDNR